MGRFGIFEMASNNQPNKSPTQQKGHQLLKQSFNCLSSWITQFLPTHSFETPDILIQGNPH